MPPLADGRSVGYGDAMNGIGRPTLKEHDDLWRRTAKGRASRIVSTYREADAVRRAMSNRARNDEIGVAVSISPHGNGYRVTVERVKR